MSPRPSRAEAQRRGRPLVLAGLCALAAASPWTARAEPPPPPTAAPLAALPPPAETYGARPAQAGLCALPPWSRGADQGLCEAARLLARAAADDPRVAQAPSSLQAWLSYSLQRQGVPLPDATARLFVGPSYGEVFLALESAAAEAQGPFGLEIWPSPAGLYGAFIEAPPPRATLSPLPRAPAPGSRLVVEGQLHQAIPAPTLWLARPSGDLSKVQARLEPGGRFQAALVFGEPGPYTLELVVDAGAGPSVEALLTLWVGVSPEAHPPGQDDAAGPPRAVLLDRLHRHRAQRGLGKLSVDPALDQLAQARAQALFDSQRLEHGAALSQGLDAARYGFAWAAEDLARAATPEAAFEALLASPAHRATLESPRPTRVGVGTLRAGPTLWVALVLAQPTAGAPAPHSGQAKRVQAATLRQAAWDHLAAARRARRLRAPTSDAPLDGLAEALALRLAAADRDFHPSWAERTQAQALGADPLYLESWVEVVVGGAPEDLLQAPGALGRGCHRAGLAVHRAPSPRQGGAPRLWMVLICARRSGD